MTSALSHGIWRVSAQLAPDPSSDGELLARFHMSQDEIAFATLVKRHATMVFGTCRRVLGNSSDADDAFQAVFIVLVRKAHSLSGRACIGNFLYGVAFHSALKARAMASKRKAKEAQVIRSESAGSGDESLELSRVLDEELTKLPEKYRQSIVMCELEGVSRKDAAKRLGIPEGTISSRLATAHRMLEKRLKAKGFTAVAITAVLGNQAFAVSDTVANAAVRAALSDAPATVTHIATEVTKMFLLKKLKLGSAILASAVMVLGVGIVVVQRNLAANDQSAEPVPALKKESRVMKDHEKIQGLWQAVTVEGDGQQAPSEAIKRIQFRFKDHDVTVMGGKVLTFELDATAKPKALLLTASDGRHKGEKIDCAIYELNGDELKICLDQRGLGGKDGQVGQRPTDFKTSPRDGRASYTFKRVKEEKKE